MTNADWKTGMSDLICGTVSELRPSAPKNAQLTLHIFQGRLDACPRPKEKKTFERQLEAYIQSKTYVLAAAHRYLARMVPPAIKSADELLKTAKLVLRAIQKKKEPNQEPTAATGRGSS